VDVSFFEDQIALSTRLSSLFTLVLFTDFMKFLFSSLKESNTKLKMINGNVKI